MNVLVTGGGGFLGRHLVKRLLRRGDNVTILGRRPHPDLEEQGVKVVLADVADREATVNACRDQQVVFHTAALAGIWGPRRDYYRTNVEGTRNVTDGCRWHGVRKLIYTSTPSVVFSGDALQGVDESAPYGTRWLCAYAETKAMAEAGVLAATTAELRTVALRPHLIWGPGDNHLIPRVIARARAGRLRIVGDGTNRVDITHVENAADAHLLAEQALDEPGRAAGKAYFLSQGEPVVLWEWINDLLRRLGIPEVRKQMPFAAAYRLGALCEAIYRLGRIQNEPPMTRFLAVELAKDHYFDIGAATRDLGYRPRKSTEEGVRELVEDLKQSTHSRENTE